MREAAIGGLSAFDEIRPPKGAAGKGAGKGRPASARSGWGPRFRRFRSRATLIVGSAGLSAIMMGIILNATVMQKGHHPAPLFAGTPAPAVAPRPAERPVAVAPAPVPEAVAPAPDAIAIAARETPAEAPRAAPAPKPPSHAGAAHPAMAHKPKVADSITRFLSGHQAHAPAAHPRPGSAKPAIASHAEAAGTAKAPLKPVHAAALAPKAQATTH